jgi:transposase-like protein
MTCGKCGSESGSIKKAGFYKNRNGIVQRYFCFSCHKTFSLSNNNGMRIQKERIHTVMKLLCESSGIFQEAAKSALFNLAFHVAFQLFKETHDK